MTLERQMDVVANNVANVNTNGYKADKSLFRNFDLRRAPGRFQGRRPPRQLCNDRANWRDFSQGAAERPRIAGRCHRRQGFLVVQTPGGERYTRDGNLQIIRRASS